MARRGTALSSVQLFVVGQLCYCCHDVSFTGVTRKNLHSYQTLQASLLTERRDSASTAVPVYRQFHTCKRELLRPTLSDPKARKPRFRNAHSRRFRNAVAWVSIDRLPFWFLSSSPFSPHPLPHVCWP